MLVECNSFVGLFEKLPRHTTAVFLDLDNTMYRYDPCHEAALLAAQQVLITEFGEDHDYVALYHVAQQAVKSRIPEHGSSHSRLLYFQHIIESIAPRQTYELAPRLETIYWNTFLTKMQIMPGLLDFLAQCTQHGTTVVVVSDLTTNIQCQKITTLGIGAHIDFLVTSEEAGADKPNAAPFLLALEKSSKKPAEVVMVGDSLSKDIAGAHALGIYAIHFAHDQSTP